MDLRKQYQDYIVAINNKKTLENFVHDGVCHNNSGPLSAVKYTQNIRDAQADMLGLFFEIDSLVVEADEGSRGEQGDGNVACRIKLSFESKSGEKEDFIEHVFYRFEQGKIKRVWSLLDGAGLEWCKRRAAGSEA